MKAVPDAVIALRKLTFTAEADPASSTVAVTPVNPLLIVSLNRSLRICGHQLGAVTPSRPPGTGCGDFEITTPSVGAIRSSVPARPSGPPAPPLRTTGFTSGTVFLPTVN